MSDLRNNPDFVLELLAVMVKRAGGYVVLSESESLGPFNLESAIDYDGVHLRLDENIRHSDVDALNAKRDTVN
jgi:hypothetical protein